MAFSICFVAWLNQASPDMGGKTSVFPLFLCTEDGLKVPHHEGNGGGGVVFSGNDEVGVFAGGFNKCVVHGAHGGEVLVGDGFEGAVALGDVA